MKKTMITLFILMLWASALKAEQANGTTPSTTPLVETQTAESLEEFDARVSLGYRNISLDRSPRAAEYEYLKSSAVGALDLEWDPLPQRFKLESYYLNKKDYFGEMDYAYRDIVLFNMYTREMYHNLSHYRFGPDDLTTPTPSFTDLNPNDQYAVENQLNRAFIRFKTPDFPFHLYAEATTIDRDGLIQQRFLRAFTGGLNLVSQSRNIDWNAKEVRVGANSHLGVIEADYSHSEKRFKALEDKVLYDTYTVPAMIIPHNLVPDLKSSSDTIKVHTTYTGRFTAAAAYSSGDKKNQDSEAKVDYRNIAGDMTLTPITGLVFFVKYRHYDVSASNPDTVTLSGLNATFNVRDSLSSKRDLLSGVIRYRLTPRLTIKGEYVLETISRDAWHGNSITPLEVAPVPSGSTPDFWDVAHRTLKSTEKLGVSYRVMSKLSLRADYSATQVTDPSYASDPDRIDSAKASVTWSPVQQIIALASYGGVREKRDNLSAPLAGGSRKSDRDQALGSVTFLVGKRSSVTASYLYLKNKTSQTITFTDTSGMFSLESGVPYGDKAEVFSLSATQAVREGVTLTADASKCYSRGNFRLDGSIAGTTDIDTLSDMRVVENIFGAGLEIEFSKNIISELRYQQRRYDDKVDNTQDGRVTTILATVSAKW
jgi:hypothetical protein